MLTRLSRACSAVLAQSIALTSARAAATSISRGTDSTPIPNMLRLRPRVSCNRSADVLALVSPAGPKEKRGLSTGPVATAARRIVLPEATRLMASDRSMLPLPA